MADDKTPVPGKPEPKEGEESPLSAKDFHALKEELQAQKQTATELKESEQYWAKKVEELESRMSAPKKGADNDDDPALTDPEKFVEELSEKGFSAIAGRVVSKKDLADLRAEISGMFSQFQGSMTQQATLMQDYPDLGKKDSELFKATTEAYKSIVKRDPLSIAAEMADLRLKAAGAPTNGERRSRAEAQSGAGGLPSITSMMGIDEAGDDVIDEDAAAVLTALGRYGVTKDVLSKERKETRKGH